MIEELYRHMEWADATVWRAVLESEDAMDDKRVRDVLLHYHMTQHAFMTIWRKEQFKFREPATFATANDILDYAREYYDALDRFLRNLDPKSIDETMVMPWAKRFKADAVPTTLRDTMMQVPMHSTYHRGQVNARLREVGAEPPLTDYIAWIWSGRPEPEWP